MSIESLDKWDRRFLSKAKEVSSWSKDPSTKVGAVAVSKKRIEISSGWNGFPRGIEDSEERLNNRSLKYQLVVHAEMNCIYNATYNGISLDGTTLYVYGLPVCSKCALGIIQVGVARVVMVANKGKLESRSIWQEEFELTKRLFQETGIEYQLLLENNYEKCV